MAVIPALSTVKNATNVWSKIKRAATRAPIGGHAVVPAQHKVELALPGVLTSKSDIISSPYNPGRRGLLSRWGKRSVIPSWDVLDSSIKESVSRVEEGVNRLESLSSSLANRIEREKERSLLREIHGEVIKNSKQRPLAQKVRERHPLLVESLGRARENIKRHWYNDATPKQFRHLTEPLVIGKGIGARVIEPPHPAIRNLNPRHAESPGIGFHSLDFGSPVGMPMSPKEKAARLASLVGTRAEICVGSDPTPGAVVLRGNVSASLVSNAATKIDSFEAGSRVAPRGLRTGSWEVPFERWLMPTGIVGVVDGPGAKDYAELLGTRVLPNIWK